MFYKRKRVLQAKETVWLDQWIGNFIWSS